MRKEGNETRVERGGGGMMMMMMMMMIIMMMGKNKFLDMVSGGVEGRRDGSAPFLSYLQLASA